MALGQEIRDMLAAFTGVKKAQGEFEHGRAYARDVAQRAQRMQASDPQRDPAFSAILSRNLDRYVPRTASTAPLDLQPSGSADGTKAATPQVETGFYAEGGPVDTGSRDPHGLSARMVREALEGVAAGVEFLARRFGLDERLTGALPVEAPADGVQRFNAGEGQPELEDVAALRRMVDPRGELVGAQLPLAMVAQAYRAKGAAAVAELLQHFRKRSEALGAQAVDALKLGDVQSGAELAAAAYNELPDGRKVEFVPKGRGVELRQIAVATGREEFRGTVSVQDLERMARSLASGQKALTFLRQAADARRTETSRRALPEYA